MLPEGAGPAGPLQGAIGCSIGREADQRGTSAGRWNHTRTRPLGSATTPGRDRFDWRRRGMVMDRTAGKRRPALSPRLAAGAMLAAIALAALTQAQASAKEAPTSEAATRSITTVLHPGWNAVAWLGPEAPVTDLFDAVPALRRAYAWDVAEQRFRGSSRNSVPLDGLSRLTTGMGLFVQVGGDAPVEWTRTASAESVLLSLREGLNLVGWAGRDGVPVEDALTRFGDLLVAAWRWDAEADAYERYRPGARAGSRTPSTLDHGDALWVQLRGDGLWWQSGRGPSTVVSVGDAPKEQQAEVRGWAHETPAVARGQLAGHLPVNGGVGLVIWGGGPAADLVATTRTRGCNVAEVRVTDPGGVGLIRYLPTRLTEAQRRLHRGVSRGSPGTHPRDRDLHQARHTPGRLHRRCPLRPAVGLSGRDRERHRVLLGAVRRQRAGLLRVRRHGGGGGTSALSRTQPG